MAISELSPETKPYIENGPDHELRRIQNFTDAIGQVEDVASHSITVDFTEDNPFLAAEQRYLTYEQRAAPTLFIVEGLQRYITSQKTELSFVPRVARGGKHSFHGVFFGDLTIGDDISVPVAVKPHEDGPVRSCLNDFLKNEAAREQGFYTPSGIGYIMAHDRAYSMTLLDETLSTLDSLDWSNFYPHTEQHPGMQEMWREVSQQTAILHSQGTRAHGDLAGRNIASSADGGTFLIDWEKARLDMRPPRDVEVSYNNSYQDLSVLVESMCLPPDAPYKSGIGIFHGKDGDWWQGFRDIFFDEYREVRMIEVDRRFEEDRKKGRRFHEANTQEELAKLTTDLKDVMAMERAICESM